MILNFFYLSLRYKGQKRNRKSWIAENKGRILLLSYTLHWNLTACGSQCKLLLSIKNAKFCIFSMSLPALSMWPDLHRFQSCGIRLSSPRKEQGWNLFKFSLALITKKQKTKNQGLKYWCGNNPVWNRLLVYNCRETINVSFSRLLAQKF